MKIAFYSPIKPPDHPVPSGDRLMARLLIKALQLGGAGVEVISALRSFRKEPPEGEPSTLIEDARAEIARIAEDWQRGGAPDLLFTYHPYYKAPDLIGPELARRFAMPYLTVEASYSRRRNDSGWRAMQDFVALSVEAAAVNISMTERDREGLGNNFPGLRSALLPPFLDVGPFTILSPRPVTGRLITVAMMRAGDKFDSFQMLVEALCLIGDTDWTLSIIGDGSARAEVEALFGRVDPRRVNWLGQLDEEDIAAHLAEASVYVWPGCGEAYGLAYLEAQAAGLPVVAQAIAGVPAVVVDGHTGLLTPAADVPAFADAIRRMLVDGAMRRRLAHGARNFVEGERSLPAASRRLMEIIREFTGLTA